MPTPDNETHSVSPEGGQPPGLALSAFEHKLEIRAELVRLAYGHSPGGIITTLFVISFTGLALWQTVAMPYLLAWLGLAFVITGARLWLILRYTHGNPSADEVRRNESRFIILAAIGGLVWGLAGLLMLTTQSAMHQFLLMFVIGGMASGAMSTLTPIISAYRAYSIISIAPLVVIWFMLEEQIYSISSLMVIVYTALIIRTANNLHHSIVKSLSLAFENSDLVNTLSAAKTHADNINRELASEIRERKRESGVRIEREKRLKLQQKALFELARYKRINEGNLQSTLEEIVRTAAVTLDVSRTGIWLYDDERDNLTLVAGYHADGSEVQPCTINRNDYITYFTAVEDNLVVAAKDVFNDIKTRELKLYFEQNHISSLLDASIRLGGKAVGVLCNEHSGETRAWSLEEQNFVAALAEMTALALGQDHRRQVEEALFHEKEKAQVTVESIGEGVITTDVNGIIEYISPVASQLTGYKAEEAIGQHLNNILYVADEKDQKPINNIFHKCLHVGNSGRFSDNLILSDKGEKHYSFVEISASAIRSRDNIVIGAVLIVHDVTELRGMAKQMSYQATHDSLTGLINRRAFEEQLGAAIASAKNEHKHHVLLYMDLDQFKLVNDTCGHMAGDELLRQIGSTLHITLRESDNLARLGGDEFGAILHGCNLDNALSIAEKMRQAVANFRFVWKERVFDLGVSIGVAPIDDNNCNMAQILSSADAACYVAKQQGRNRVHVYQADDAMISQRYGEIQWIQKIKHALDEDRFVLYYQAAASLNKKATGDSYCEILLRMLDEDGELVSPMQFIPAAERYQMMPDIDRWVIKTTLESLAAKTTVLNGFNVCAINLSAQSLCDEHFLDYLLDVLKQTGVPPQGLCFEITETAAIANIQKATDFIATLKSLGCQFALDDFGSGLSSFSYLKNLDVDYLKIDGNFVKDMAESKVDYAMVNAINQMGRLLNKKTIAEYVENEKILTKLTRLGVDYAQGYHVARPLALRAIQEERKLAEK